MGGWIVGLLPLLLASGSNKNAPTEGIKIIAANKVIILIVMEIIISTRELRGVQGRGRERTQSEQLNPMVRDIKSSSSTREDQGGVRTSHQKLVPLSSTRGKVC